jgi:hypothetical protein
MAHRQRIDQMEHDIVPQVGSYLTIDEWGPVGTTLLHDETEWELCDFRIEAGNGMYQIATRIEVTGWKLKPMRGQQWIRVRVILPADPGDWEMVGDTVAYKQDTVLHGWLLVTEREKVWNAEKADRLRQEWLRICELRAATEAEEAARRQSEVEALEKAEAERKRLATLPAHRAAHLEL